MKTNLAAAFLVFQLVTAGLVLAQAPEEDREADKTALRALGKQYEEAINQGNLSPLKEAVLPEVSAVFITGHEVKGIDAMQKYYDEIKKQLGEGSVYTVKLKPDATDFHGDMAIAHGASDEHVKLGSGREVNYESRWTAILKKVGGKWMVARLHVSLDPFENPIVVGRAKIQRWIWGGGGLLLGAILVFLLTRCCCKKRGAS